MPRARAAATKDAGFYGRALTFEQASPASLFVPDAEIKTQVWDIWAPVWGTVVKGGFSSQFDEITYAQMLEDLKARNLRVYMDQDHRTARFFSEPDVPALAFYCGVVVNHEGKEWRRLNLAGHTCADKVPFDAATMPEGLAGFRCYVTPDGRRVLPNYQALSIHFDPFGEDHRGHPVGQSLICVSAVNGPHLPGAIPAGGAFSRRTFDMAGNKKSGTFAGNNGGEGEGGESASVEMDELRTLLEMPEGASDAAVLGAAIAVLKASKPHAEPDGDEAPLEGDTSPDAEKLTGNLPEEMKGYAKKAVTKWARTAGVLRIFSKELGVEKPAPGALLKGFLAFKAKTVPAAEHQALTQRITKLETEAAANAKREADEKQQVWERELKELLDQAGPAPVGQGLISGDKRAELEAQARKYKAPIADVRTWLPAPVQGVLSGKPQPPAAAPGTGTSGKMVGGDTADQVRAFRDAYQKDTGRQIRYEAAAQIVTGFARKGAKYEYAAAKAQADRLGDDCLIKGNK